MKALAIIFNGFEEEEAMAPFALLRRAGVELTIASTSKTVTGCHNISITDCTLLNDIDTTQFDCLIVPGGPHYKFLRESKMVHDIISFYALNNKVLCGICAAPTIFGQLGYLKGKNYTCFTSMNKDFGGYYSDNGCVVDGNLITAKSVAYSLDFAYEIIRILLGEERLNEVYKHIYYEK